jgi:hypothetical protein
MLSEVQDTMRAMCTPEFVEKMADKIRATRETSSVEHPGAAVDQLVKELPKLNDGEKDSILENLIRNQDYTKWGMVNAVTAVANLDDIDHHRGLELQSIGWNIAELNTASWSRIAQAEKVAA